MPIRVGILGAGAFASRRHLPDLSRDPRAAVVAACRRDPEQLARFADHFGIPERFRDWRQMLDQAGLDGVLIATPHAQHFVQAREALERGLHVLLEKPMALSGDQAAMLAGLARERALTLAVAFNPPYWRHTQALRDGLAQGRIGDLEAADLRWIGSAAAVFGKAPLPEHLPGVVPPTLFRADPDQGGGGILMDGGGHLLSELLWVTGRAPRRISALMDRKPDDMRSVLALECDGFLATVTLVADSGHPQRRVASSYDGSRGTAQTEGAPFCLTWRGVEGTPETRPEADLPAVPSPVQDWLDCLETGATPRGSAGHGVEVTRLLEAAYQAAQTGKTVSVGPPEVLPGNEGHKRLQ